MIRCTLRAGACALGITAVLAACQPVDDLDEPVDDDLAAGQVDRRGAPDSGMPATLAATLAQTDVEAARWQEGARVAEVAVEVDGDRLTEVRVTYVAPDADRLLTVTLTEEGQTEERPTLGAFDLEPIPADALAQLPPWPEGLQEPTTLMEGSGQAFDACDVEGAPDAVLYASGAPLAWDPEAGDWGVALGWTATVTTGDDGDGAVVDPVTAERFDCLSGTG